MWCVEELDSEYIAKMEDVLETYEKPLDVTEPVICIDEKPVSLHDDVRPGVPAAPGVIAPSKTTSTNDAVRPMFSAP